MTNHPHQIGRYQVISVIARGDMNTIYVAHDPVFNRKVAVKILPHELLQDSNIKARFNREAKVIASLEHPAIVPVYDYGEIDGQPYFVMRLMTGKSLAEHLKQGPLSVDETLRILRRISAALDEAHNKGVVHRDLKPDNILFDHNNEPYLSDFGIAKLSEGGATLTGASIVGTPAYMSPEQGRGETDIDGRSDIYSLGVILFEMLTGRTPFDADTPTGQALKHITDEVPNIRDFNPDLPWGIQIAIDRAMAKQKIVRYSTARDMTDALAAAIAGNLSDGGESSIWASLSGKEPADETNTQKISSVPRSFSTGPGVKRPTSGGRRATPVQSLEVKPMQALQDAASPGYQEQVQPSQPKVKRGSSRRIFIVSIFVMMIAAVVLAGLVFGPQIQQQTMMPPNTEVILIAPTETLEVIPTALIVVESSSTPVPATSTSESQDTSTPVAPTDTPMLKPTATETPEPTGPIIGGADKLAFIVQNNIWVANLDGTDAHQLTNSGGNKFGLQWTPDGQAVTYIAGKCVEKADLVSGSIEKVICANWADYVAAFEISPDGKYVAFSSSDGLYILSYDLIFLGQIRRPEQLETDNRTCAIYKSKTKSVRWGADGQQIAVVVVSAQQTRQIELIRVLQMNGCGKPFTVVDEFPGTRFNMNEYDNKPVIVSFGWDGYYIFALNVNRLNEFGDFYQYNLSTHQAQISHPLDTRCCFRDFRWSPDRDHLLFVFQDTRYGKGIEIYYIPYGALGTGEIYQPIPLPAELFSNAKEEKPQPVLRPAQ